MKQKELMILKFLNSQDSWITSFSMSALLGVSVRSIKSYIQEINAACPDLIQSSRKGFLVPDKARLASIVQQAKASPSPPQTIDDRRKYILSKLLLEKERYDLDELASELSISYTTLTNELYRLKNEIAEYELVIKTKKNQIYLSGPEVNKKKMVSTLIYEDAKDSFLSIKMMQNCLPHFDLTALRKIVFSVLREHHYFMDEFSLLNLVMHIAITMERHLLYSTALTDKSCQNETLINPDIHAIVESISNQVSETFQMQFTEKEIYDFSLLVMTRVIQDATNEIRPEDLEEVVGVRITALIAQMQRRTKETFNITLTNSDFTIRFSIHIKNMLIRLENGLYLRNPQLTDIKNSYPFIYDVSVYLANIITEETGYAVSEDEISYIALHVGVLIEERKVIKHEVRAILLNPQYFYKSLNLAERCAQVFESNLHIANIISSEDELKSFSDYDLILTTIPLSEYPGKPFVQISWYINSKDILVVSNKIEEILTTRIKIKVEAKLKHMFRKELFFAGHDFKDQDDALNSMADKLIDQGYADPAFKQKLFEREKVSSSAYSNIAMPHPLEMCAFTSVIGVSLHPGGILWNGARVNIVFLLAINIRDRLFFKDIFDFITEVISDSKNLKMLLETKTYEEFMNVLVSFAK